MLTPEIIEARRKIIEARRKLVAKNERELSKQPPRPLQPGDKVLVEAEVLHVYTTDAEVEMTSSTMQIPLFSNRHLAINIPLSSIRPFPQEESNQDRQQTLEKR